MAGLFLHSISDRPYPAESDPKSIPFSAGARRSLSPIITRERHGGDEIRKRAHLQAGSEQRGVARLAKKGETRSLTRRIRTGFAHSSVTLPYTGMNVRATPSLPINGVMWDKTALFLNNWGPS